MEKNHQPAADVLYVWDRESFLYVKNRWTPVSYNLIDQSFEEALHSGTSSDQIYLFDLEKVDLHQYRAILFMNVYKLTETQRTFIRQKVARDGRTLIWNYLPGYTDGNRNSLDFVSEVTGFKLTAYQSKTKPVVRIASGNAEYSLDGPVNPMAVITDSEATVLARLKEDDQPVVARKSGAGFNSVYSTLPLHDSNFFRAIFKKAGCHVYDEANDFTYANSGLLLIHTKTGGARTLHLKNGKTVTMELPPFSTCLLDADSGDVLLK